MSDLQATTPDVIANAIPSANSWPTRSGSVSRSNTTSAQQAGGLRTWIGVGEVGGRDAVAVAVGGGLADPFEPRAATMTVNTTAGPQVLGFAEHPERCMKDAVPPRVPVVSVAS